MSATSQVVLNIMLIMLPVHYLNHWETGNIDVVVFCHAPLFVISDCTNIVYAV